MGGKRGRPKRQPEAEREQAVAVLRRLRNYDAKREFTAKEKVTLVRKEVIDLREARLL